MFPPLSAAPRYISEALRFTDPQPGRKSVATPAQKIYLLIFAPLLDL
jgi:hypothetical protein